MAPAAGGGATDAAGVPALDTLSGWVAAGDVAGVTAARLDGRRVDVRSELDGWPPPALLGAGPPEGPGGEPQAGPDGDGPPATPGPAGGGPAASPAPAGDFPSAAQAARILVTDRSVPPAAGLVTLHPPSLVAGVGASSDAEPAETAALLATALRHAGLAPESVAAVATIDRRARHPAVSGLGRPVHAWTAAELARVAVPHPSPTVDAAVGTPSVAEAAALLTAGPGASLVVPKRTSAKATVAVARRARPPGHLSLVGLGPGQAAHRTPAAAAAVRAAELVIGYRAYVEQAADLLHPGQEVARWPIGAEAERATQALTEARRGRRVALVCSGDAGVYAMASLVLELAGELAPDVEVDVVPGVSAALASAARLGAPLGHDHAVISLSDLHTPWTTIEARVRAAATADLAVAFYNPRSAGRNWQLGAALAILAAHRPPSTPAGVVTDAGRPAEQVEVTTLAALDPSVVGMTTCVIIGSSTTRIVAGRMVTPRGYAP